MTFLCLLTILPGIRLLYDRQHVFLCFHTKFLSVIRHMSRIARCHTFLTMNFAMVLQCLYRIHSCSVDSYRVNKASLSVSIQQFDLVQIYTRLNLNIYVDGRQKKSILPYYFLFLSYGLNTEFEHRGRTLAAETSWHGVVFRFVFKAKEKALAKRFVST